MVRVTGGAGGGGVLGVMFRGNDSISIFHLFVASVLASEAAIIVASVSTSMLAIIVAGELARVVAIIMASAVAIIMASVVAIIVASVFTSVVVGVVVCAQVLDPYGSDGHRITCIPT